MYEVNSNKKVISFTGGLGAQIISAAAYLYIEKVEPGNQAAHFGYFSRPLYVASPGNRGELSHWKWELNNYGLTYDNFVHSDSYPESCIIWDGKLKAKIGNLGLSEPTIRERFPINEQAKNTANSIFNQESYACLHVRRGDYLNVASYLVSDDAFLRAISFLPSLINNLLVVSDSALSSSLFNGLLKLNLNSKTFIGGDPYLTHCLMRLSKILICSNSQFAWSAARLRMDGLLSLYPSKHDTAPLSPTNEYLEEIREFQLVTKFH